MDIKIYFSSALKQMKSGILYACHGHGEIQRAAYMGCNLQPEMAFVSKTLFSPSE